MMNESSTTMGRMLTIGLCVFGFAGASLIATAQEQPAGERREIRRVLVMQDGVDFMRAPRMGQHGGPAGMRQRGDSMVAWLTRMGDEIGLTPQQRGKLTEHAAAARPEMRKLRQEIREQARQLRELSPGDPKYATASAEASKRIGELTTRLAQQGVQLRSKAWAELTPEQRTKVQSIRERMKAQRGAMGERMRERMRDRMGPPRPPEAPR